MCLCIKLDRCWLYWLVFIFNLTLVEKFSPSNLHCEHVYGNSKAVLITMEVKSQVRRHPQTCPGKDTHRPRGPETYLQLHSSGGPINTQRTSCHMVLKGEDIHRTACCYVIREDCRHLEANQPRGSPSVGATTMGKCAVDRWERKRRAV